MALRTALRTKKLLLQKSAVVIPAVDRLSVSYSSGQWENSERSRRRGALAVGVVAAGLGVGIGALYLRQNLEDSEFATPLKVPTVQAVSVPQTVQESTGSKLAGGAYIPGLPTYTMSEVQKHSDPDKGLWCTFNEGVYDVTKFVKEHPGGENILLAAGGSTEPFWMLYSIHKSPHVYEILESLRIGNLSHEDVGSTSKDMKDPYGNEPRRHPALEPRSTKPFNAEPVPSLLAENYITPNDLFYVRNHLPVPDLTEEEYELDIEGLGIKDKTLKMADIRKFPRHTITAAIQCAGNRRNEINEIKKVKGLRWGFAAISNATWTGAKLRDVLLAAGVNENDKKIKHVHLEGYDLDPTSAPYSISIPIAKAMGSYGDVLLAYEMNGQKLSRDHGYPIRVVVPGVAGARNVKWLNRIVLSDVESSGHWQQNDYKSFSPSVDWNTVDYKSAPAIQDMPIQSAICEPLDGDTAKVKDGKMKVRGYAYSGGGRRIIRVDVTGDGGRTWHVADLEQDNSIEPQTWSWTLWETYLPVPSGSSKMEVWVKAVDSSYNTQPESFANVWNLRGLLGNAYHCILVDIEKPKTKKGWFG